MYIIGLAFWAVSRAWAGYFADIVAWALWFVLSVGVAFLFGGSYYLSFRGSFHAYDDKIKVIKNGANLPSPHAGTTIASPPADADTLPLVVLPRV
jgi:hypothetical protein